MTQQVEDQKENITAPKPIQQSIPSAQDDLSSEDLCIGAAMTLSSDDRAYLEHMVSGQVTGVLAQVTDLNRTLRGANGSDGLITRISILQLEVNNLKQTVEKLTTAVQTLGETVQNNKSDVKDLGKSLAEYEDRREKKDDEYGNWKWFRDSRLGPIVMIVGGYLALEAVKLLLVALASKAP